MMVRGAKDRVMEQGGESESLAELFRASSGLREINV